MGGASTRLDAVWAVHVDEELETACRIRLSVCGSLDAVRGDAGAENWVRLVREPVLARAGAGCRRSMTEVVVVGTGECAGACADREKHGGNCLIAGGVRAGARNRSRDADSRDRKRCAKSRFVLRGTRCDWAGVGAEPLGR